MSQPAASQSARKKLAAHVVPKFYGCYLLRSIPKPNSFYIGSTPDPVRRLRQHNGELKAGAYKTKRKGFRPWEMIMIVHGFPNKIAALQFEHAWQHSYQTRHIDKTARITTSKTAGRSVHHKLGNVRLLLNSPFFNKMNLKIQIFNSETYKVWYTNKFGINLMNQLIQIDYTNSKEIDEVINMQNVADFKNKCLENDTKIISKFQEVLQYGEHSCHFCKDTIDYTKTNTEYPLVALCYHEFCDQISHLSCIAKHFKDQKEEQENIDANINAMKKLTKRAKLQEITKVPESTLIPKKGACPVCEKVLLWTTLVRYSTMARLVIGYDGKEPTVDEQEDELAEIEATQDTF